MEIPERILKEFSPITLDEMDSVKLLDRMDTKFIFNKEKLPEILSGLKGDYNVLNIENRLISDYETLYFDTENLDLYMSHHNGRINRYKIRYRKYVHSNLHYFEIKFKNNKDRTIKSRIKRPEIESSIMGKAKRFLEDKTCLSADILQPVFFVNYSRITLVNKHIGERLTIDLNLSFKNSQAEKTFEPLVIAELKQQELSRESPFAKLMKSNKIRNNSISKYCLGVTQLFPDVKCNNFKPKLLTLNKIIYAHS